MLETVSEQAHRLYRSVGEVLALPVLQETARPLDTVAAAQAISEQASRLLATAVNAARRDGITWQQIGEVLGVSRQAAFQRFSHSIPAASNVSSETRAAEARVEPAVIERAATAIDHLVSGEWQAVVDEFDDALRESVTADGLAAAWSKIISAAGTFDRRAGTEAVRALRLIVTNTRLVFEHDECTARLVFRDDGRITGLFILAGSPS
ncbi:DUF3887 domain-containing protein [Rathayibacter rathayi]|uniref:DUF3887 domain-containing protein n=1 Tax=Rathayibacter rathayi TaxID=33887 RepID=UPI000BD965F9|nr:DUF3887 domain-containing protein [Rathayibacter rathayi]AZZ50074.1 DUF3887 domain-containing protein [Rathayibacter rathayi]MWV75672.1 DUF3887 domain-containing protein [Rathayibacter rathayi NCPPB 2980 = VKM Ac-1601]PPF43508.1 DUF3887 domain-containing protein [Rathayibacter rathayi]PPG65642.1 DUF3887 domain-containing protein [Rathayibacter rathayi]PPG74847.1 DUF3887 domain-containing protein [Rathayibacter rathayi]